MNPTQIRATYEARTADVQALRSLYTQAEGRDLTAPEQRSEAALEASIANHDAAIARGLKTVEDEARSAEFMERLGAYETGSGQEEQRTKALLPMSGDEMRAITSTTVGSAIIPPDRTKQVFTEIRRRSALLGQMSHFQTDRLTFNVPRVSVGIEAGIVAESALIPEATPTAETSSVDLRKTGIRTVTSIEAWQASDPSVADLLAAEHIKAHQRAATRFALLGDGVGEPQGVIGHPSVNDTSNGSTTASLDDLHELISRLVAKGLEVDEIAVVLSPKAFAAVERTKNVDGNYLLAAPGAATERRIWGARVILDDHIPTNGGTGTNETTIAAGAWKYAAFVTNSTEARVEASADAGWENGDVHVRSMFFWGTKVIDPDAFETLSAVTV